MRSEFSMIFIDVQDSYRDSIIEDVLLRAAEYALQFDKKEGSASLSLRITDQNEMRTLNQQYRGLDKSTDVLSFPADFLDPDLGSRYLGDVVISFPEAAAQAEKRGHGVEAELQLLVVHGVLHLLGYDHGTAQEKKTMWELQDRVLKDLGLDIEVGEE